VEIEEGANEEAIDQGLRSICEQIDSSEFHDGGGEVRFVSLEDGHESLEESKNDGEVWTVTLIACGVYDNGTAPIEELNKAAAERFGQEAADRVFPISN